MAHSMLPYPGRYESHASWMQRCDEWERNRRHNQSHGLSGHPNKQGIWLADEGTTHTLANGRKVTVVRKGYGWRASRRIKEFAIKNGLGFEEFNGNGCSGMCERIDGIAFVDEEKEIKRQECYNNDTH